MTNSEKNNELNANRGISHEDISDDDRRDNHEKKNIMKILIKIIVIIVIFSTAFYFIYFQSGRGRAKFILSNEEVSSIKEGKMVTKYVAGDKIYFYIKDKGDTINANTVTIKIDIYKDKVYSRYKQITYEINRDFTELSAFIPGQYFKNPGKYKIEVFLDGSSISGQEIDIVR